MILLPPYSESRADSWTAFQKGGDLGAENTRLPTEGNAENGVAWEVSLAGYNQSSLVVEGT